MTATYGIHPLAEILPALEGSEFDDLVADIKMRGLREKITLYENLVLDGRNRYLACVALGIDVRNHVVVWGGSGSPEEFVISKNLMRRNLSQVQRAQYIIEFSKSATVALSQEEIASRAKVSTRSVKRAAKIEKKGVPELKEAVKRGKVSGAAAAKVADMKPAKQRKLVEKGPEAIVQATRPAAARVDPAALGDGSIQALRFHWKHADEETRAVFMTEVREGIRQQIAPANGKTDQFGRPHAAPGSLLKGARS
jgi:hypothetical protein